MTRQPLTMPWAPGTRAYCLPGSVVLKMALGEAPESVPMWADVRSGRLAVAQEFDGGVVDRITKHFAGGSMRVTRVHAAAASLSNPGARHLKFDDDEQVFGLARTFRVDVPRGTPIVDLVDSLSQVSTVESAMPNYVTVTPFEVASVPSVEERWAPWSMIRAAEALEHERGDSAVIVGVVDSGIAPQHPELAGKLRSGFDTVQLGQTDLASGLRLLGDRQGVDTRPIDGFVGHGMGCAGVIAARGLAMAPGVAGDAQVLPLRALGAALFPGKEQAVGIGSATDLDMALKMAVDLGAKVLNLSFGTDDAALEPQAPKPHADVVRYALERGCVLVAASGNNGQESCYWPAAYPGVLAIGAVDAHRNVSAFCTRGEHVALCAPGERIHTLALQGYQSATGTSFAAPFVAGVAALLVARAQRRSMPIDSTLVRTLLVESCAPFDKPQPKGCGAGVLDAYAALQALDAHIDRTFPDDSGQVEDE